MTTSFATLPFSPKAKPLTDTLPLQRSRIALAQCQTLERSLGLTTSFPSLPFSPKARPLTDTLPLQRSKIALAQCQTLERSLGLTTSFPSLPFSPKAKRLTDTLPLQRPRIALAQFPILERSLGLTTSFPTLPFRPKAKPLTDAFALADFKARARNGRTAGASLAHSRSRRPSAVDRPFPGVQLFLSCLPASLVPPRLPLVLSCSPLVPPWCLGGCPLGSFLPLSGASLVPPRLSKWSFPASLVPPWCLAGCPISPFLPSLVTRVAVNHFAFALWVCPPLSKFQWRPARLAPNPGVGPTAVERTASQRPSP